MKLVEWEALKGVTLIDICVHKDQDRGDFIEFIADDDTRFFMLHEQDCCESVVIEDICGDLKDLVGSPILDAFENTTETLDKDDDHVTYSFYTLSTSEGAVTIRWYGISNGYYSESVSLFRSLPGHVHITALVGAIVSQVIYAGPIEGVFLQTDRGNFEIYDPESPHTVSLTAVSGVLNKPILNVFGSIRSNRVIELATAEQKLLISTDYGQELLVKKVTK